MNKEEMFELLVYMITSAAGLKGEPKIYGPLRLIEASQRLAGLMLQEDGTDENLRELVSIIENGTRKSSTDEEGFYRMLDEAAEKLVDCLEG